MKMLKYVRWPEMAFNVAIKCENKHCSSVHIHKTETMLIFQANTFLMPQHYSTPDNIMASIPVTEWMYSMTILWRLHMTVTNVLMTIWWRLHVTQTNERKAILWRLHLIQTTYQTIPWRLWSAHLFDRSSKVRCWI